jgi:hypothetical protein
MLRRRYRFTRSENTIIEIKSKAPEILFRKKSQDKTELIKFKLEENKGIENW